MLILGLKVKEIQAHAVCKGGVQNSESVAKERCPIHSYFMLQEHAELSLRAGGRGFSPGILRYIPGYFKNQ